MWSKTQSIGASSTVLKKRFGGNIPLLFLSSMSAH